MTSHIDRHRADPQRDDGIDPDRLAALVRDCVGMMQSGGIARLELKYGKLQLMLRAHEASSASIGGNGGTTTLNDTSRAPIGAESNGYVITAPMIGTFYASSAPGEPPFVTPGDLIAEGQTIGIIEAMKIMNEIAADRAGVVGEIVAVNGQTVEYGSPLIRLSQSAS